jgi:uncharacterized protein (DUF433 family)
MEIMAHVRKLEIGHSMNMSIAETATVTGVSARKINRMIDDGLMPMSSFKKVGRNRFVKAFAAPLVRFGAGDGAILSKDARLEAMKSVARYTKTNWVRLIADPDQARGFRFESGVVSVALGEIVSSTMVGLGKLAEAQRRVVDDPDVRGGIPTLRGTRIGVYEIAATLAVDGIDAVLEDYPALTREDVEAASIYAQAHPRMGRPRTDRVGHLTAEYTVDLNVES